MTKSVKIGNFSNLGFALCFNWAEKTEEEFALGKFFSNDAGFITIQSRNGDTFISIDPSEGPSELHRLCKGSSYYEELKAFTPYEESDYNGNRILFIAPRGNAFLKRYPNGNTYLVFNKD